ncbi:hemolysin family protein [Terrimonas sp. NA20]|uniref:Hemolysin family protein n=1 Tax=Terrimonas ginsenosidimutans TaxID=2908004 RepID=A0ABS9KRV0_9BACT|nr:hemolysin family protein [Terrimonas ginsenosidimutans]MCG2615048.1 hemolysin family protein [Terrimonas ginsenosidimutans]
MTWDIILTILLVLLNGFFVAAEFAIVKVRVSQIEVSEGHNKTISAIAKNVVNNLDSYLAATQLGITLASLGLGWVGEDVMTSMILSVIDGMGWQMPPETAHKIALPVAFLVITILHIVFGELAPKSLAIRKPVPTTFAVAVPLKIFFFIFRPFIWLLNGFANFILRLIGIKPAGEHGDIHSEEELRVIIAESHEGGVLEETERSLIQNVFSLGDRQVSALMTPRNEITWLDLNADPVINKEKILSTRHTLYPLAKDSLDQVVGFVYSKDLISDNLDDQLLRLSGLQRKMLLVTPHNRAYQVLEQFRREKVYQAMVVDEFGSVKGIITINDIVDALFGDISENDEFEYAIQLRADGSMLVDAQIPFDEFVERLQMQTDRAKDNLTGYVTLGGFLLEKLGRIPKKGDRVKWRNMRMEVAEMDQLRIAKILVVPAAV